jgi:hypothetical protein
MTDAFDIGAPTLLVNVYEAGRLITQVPCESADEAAGVVTEWEALDGIKCEVEDVGTLHQPEDVLAPEPEDAFEADSDYGAGEADYGDGTQ